MIAQFEAGNGALRRATSPLYGNSIPEGDRVEDGSSLIGDVDAVGEIEPSLQHLLASQFPCATGRIGDRRSKVSKLQAILIGGHDVVMKMEKEA